MNAPVKTLSLARAALWVLATFWMLQVAMTWLVGLFPHARFDPISLGAIELLVLGAVCYLMALAYRPAVVAPGGLADLRRLNGIRSSHWSWPALGGGLGLAMKYPAGAVQSLVERRWPTPAEELAAQADFLRHETAGQILALVFVLALLGPAIEELFYRGVLFQLLKDGRGATVATLFVSLAFVVVHPQPRTWPALLLLSGAMTYVRLRSGAIWPSLAAHVAFNSSTLLTVIGGWNALDGASSSPGLVLFGTLFSAGLLLLAWRASPRFGESI